MLEKYSCERIKNSPKRGMWPKSFTLINKLYCYQRLILFIKIFLKS